MCFEPKECPSNCLISDYIDTVHYSIIWPPKTTSNSEFYFYACTDIQSAISQSQGVIRPIFWSQTINLKVIPVCKSQIELETQQVKKSLNGAFSRNMSYATFLENFSHLPSHLMWHSFFKAQIRAVATILIWSLSLIWENVKISRTMMTKLRFNFKIFSFPVSLASQNTNVLFFMSLCKQSFGCFYANTSHLMLLFHL